MRELQGQLPKAGMQTRRELLGAHVPACRTWVQSSMFAANFQDVCAGVSDLRPVGSTLCPARDLQAQQAGVTLPPLRMDSQVKYGTC